MGGFAFGGLNVASTKKSLAAELIQDIVQIDHTSDKGPYILVLLDEYYFPDKLKKIEIFLERNGIKNYKAVNALNCIIPKEDLKGEISRFYRINQSKWKDHAEGAKGVIAVGAALYAINQSADLMTFAFYDIMFNKSYYWSPDAGTWVFPIDTFQEIFAALQQKADNMYHVDSDGPVNTYKTHFAEYQFKQVLSLRLSPLAVSKPELIKVETPEDFEIFAKQHMKEKIIAWDLETGGLDFMKHKIGCITFSFDGQTGYYVPWKIVNKKLLNEMLETCDIQVGANLKFDVRFLRRNGIPAARIDEDTVQLGHILNEQRLNGLKPSAYYYTPFGGYDRELDRYREKTGITDFTLIPEHILFPYATMDAIVTYRVFLALLEQLRSVDERMPNEKDPEWTMERYYREVMMPAVRAFAEIEFRGVYTDRAMLAQSRVAMQAEIQQIENELAAVWQCGGDFDFNSSHQLGKLFERLGFEDLGRTKAKNGLGDYKTSDACLERWAKRGHPEILKLQRLRTLNTLLKTFISSVAEDAEKGWEQYVRLHEDGSWRMHPTFNVMRTESGRCKSDSPNMQNVPAGHGKANNDLAALVKRCITSPDPKEYYLATLDYASLQMRLAAIDTNLNEDGPDKNLYTIYIDPKMGGDMHSRTGYGVFADGREFELEIVEVESEGVTKTFFGGEIVKTKNRGEVEARALVASDVLF
jgi:DNA polymerase I-like protein with 3'-5' exonuclease and polymerase domains